MNKIITDYDKRRLDAATEVASLVARTAGPYGHNVDFIGGQHPVMLRDGLKVMEYFSPTDQMVAGIKARMFEAAHQTVRAAGDGTTTTTILLHAVYSDIIRYFNEQEQSPNPEPYSRREIANGVREAAKWCVKQLESAKRLDLSSADDRKLLFHVATIAGGNDPEVGRVVSDLIVAVGIDGYITTEYDQAITTIEYELRPGYRMPFGVINPTMIRPNRRNDNIQNPFVVLCKDHLNTNEQLNPIIKAWNKVCADAQDTVPLVLITAGIDTQAMSTMILRTGVNNVQLPWYTIRVNAGPEVWEDLASITGARPISTREGFSVARFEGKHGARVDSIVVSLDHSVIGINPECLAASGLIERLSESKADSPEVEARIASLEGRVGAVKLPLSTQARKIWATEVFEDAYLASQSAVKSGIAPGAGRALYDLGLRITSSFSAIEGTSRMIGVSACANALTEPTFVLLTNGGIPDNTAIQLCLDMGAAGYWDTYNLDDILLSNAFEGYDKVELCDAEAEGILDSAAVLSSAITSAFNEAADWIETSIGVLPKNYAL